MTFGVECQTSFWFFFFLAYDMPLSSFLTLEISFSLAPIYPKLLENLNCHIFYHRIVTDDLPFRDSPELVFFTHLQTMFSFCKYAFISICRIFKAEEQGTYYALQNPFRGIAHDTLFSKQSGSRARSLHRCNWHIFYKRRKGTLFDFKQNP